MKTTLLILTVLSMLATAAPSVLAFQDATPEDAVSTFVGALKAGDMDTLEAITGGKLLERFNKMRNSNPRYKSFLVRRYRHLAVEETAFQNLTNDKVIALVKMSFDGAASEVLKWTMNRNADGKWRIVDEAY
jgi:hypothetical protein